ncbi:hypothetical protein [Mycobacterium paraterrae]|uniref:Lipoprotein LpqN n=1 Tax=Mycobacterium paraterrae TaxID=577492 RepID=A0ABY3VND7_9MYCO|nr:hypothetical protein [Mycobacterium paraterrae]UMB68671.1 hypothetical protein MKK62_20005 [Mycobacterium paraterrae]
MTNLLPRVLLPALAAAAILAVALTGCARTVDGVGAWTGGSAAQARQPRTGNFPPAPGIETTVPDHIPPNAFLCFPGPASGGIGTVAQVVAAAAPRITITLPDRWTSEQGHEDLALSLTGPDSMTGTVTIAATKLGPAAAFTAYTDNLAHSKPDLQVDIVGAKFCGYSSQKLTGTFGGSSGSVVFADRITHIWTNTGNYLVVVHMEGPEDAAGFASAKAALMQDFAVVIP